MVKHGGGLAMNQATQRVFQLLAILHIDGTNYHLSASTLLLPLLLMMPIMIWSLLLLLLLLLLVSLLLVAERSLC
jgi:hypothetical protein